MIITDTTVVNETLAAILAKQSLIAVDANDVKQLFGDNPKLRMIRVAGNTMDEVVPQLKEDFTHIGGCPKNYLAAYVSMTLLMRDLETLSELTEAVGEYKQTLIFETEPEGEIVLYYFF